MDPVDKKKTIKYFFDTAPACRNERVKMKILRSNYKNPHISSLALWKHMCAVARADALVKVLMHYDFFGWRLLNFARPREIQQSHSRLRKDC